MAPLCDNGEAMEAGDDEADDVCHVCHDPLDEDCVSLPDCRHRFHLCCVIEFSQYDVRCPTCRTVPGRLVRREIPRRSAATRHGRDSASSNASGGTAPRGGGGF